MIAATEMRRPNQQDMSEEIREECGKVVFAKVAELVKPVKEKLPPFIYIDSWSVNYKTKSRSDWQLKVIHLDVKNLELYAADVQFQYRENNGMAKLGTPNYTNREVLGLPSWLTYAQQLTEVLLEVLKKVRNGERLETPKHEVTSHLLVPVPYSHPEMAKIIDY